MRPAFRRLGVAALILVFATGLVSMHVHAFTRLSLIDEIQHIDYLHRAESGGIVRTGDKISPFALHEAACRGLDNKIEAPTCSSLSQYPAGGINSADQNPPLYYYATLAVSRVVQLTGQARDIVTAGRLAGAAWLGLGLFVLWLIAEQLGAKVSTRAAMVVLIGSNAGVLYMSSIVNPDSTALLSGGLVLLAVLLWERGRAPLVLAALAAAAAVLLKNSNILGVIAVALYLALRAIAPADETEAGRSRRAYLVAAAVTLVSSAVAEYGWLLLRRHIGLVSVASLPLNQQYHIDHLSPSQVLQVINYLATPLQQVTVTPFYFPVWPANLAALLVMGAVVGAICFHKGLGRLRSMAFASVAVLVLGGPFLVVTVFVLQKVLSEVPVRYGFSLLPMLGALTAYAAGRSRVGTTALWLVALASLLVQPFNLHNP
jgi:hypothetical protein